MIYVLVAAICFALGFFAGAKHVIANHREYQGLFKEIDWLTNMKQSTNTIVYVEYADERYFAYSEKHIYICDATSEDELVAKLTEKFTGTFTIRSET